MCSISRAAPQTGQKKTEPPRPPQTRTHFLSYGNINVLKTLTAFSIFLIGVSSLSAHRHQQPACIYSLSSFSTACTRRSTSISTVGLSAMPHPTHPVDQVSSAQLKSSITHASRQRLQQHCYPVERVDGTQPISSPSQASNNLLF